MQQNHAENIVRISRKSFNALKLIDTKNVQTPKKMFVCKYLHLFTTCQIYFLSPKIHQVPVKLA